jgi:NitT/TauT family transport system permease protein
VRNAIATRLQAARAPLATGSVPAAASRAKPGRLMRACAALGPWIALVAVWELAIARGWVQSSLLPPPSSFLGYAVENNLRLGFGADAMTIPGAIVSSVWRVLTGMALGFIAAVATGIAISRSTMVSTAVLPLVRGLAPIAPIAWIPLGIMLLGVGNATAVFIVFVGVYFLLTLSTVAAVASVDQRLIKTARTFGASTRQVWWSVIFPAVLPQVFTMLRLNFFAAWMAVLAAEMVGLKNGVGMMVILGREMFNGNLIMLGICIVGIVGYAVDAFLLFLQRRVLWWQPAR